MSTRRETIFTLTILAVIGVILAALLLTPNIARAKPRPIPIPAELQAARDACPNGSSLSGCRGELRKALAAVAWAKKERKHRWRPTVQYAIKLACASQPTVNCAWLDRMIGCESGHNPLNRNHTSTAAGLAQFLDGTWSGNAYHRFSVYDPIANALGAAWLAARAGYAPWYASKGCWS